jgi:glycosyltransferase involved in cell wall biosynthesis
MIKTIKSFRATHIHAFNAFYFLNFIPAIIVSRIPVVYRCGDKPAPHNAFWRKLWGYISRNVNYFVVDSKFIRETLISFYNIPLQKMSVIYSPAPRRLSASAVPLPTMAKSDKAFRFVYAGQLIPEKGPEILLEAFSRVCANFPFAHLLIIGRISDWSGDDWARMLQDRVTIDPTLRNCVHFMGWLENVPDLMRQCHVHVCPSLCEEGYGLVAVEAKSVGIPSIIFPSGGLKELIQNGVDGRIVGSKSVDELAETLEYYLRNPEIAKEHGCNARKSLDSMRMDSFSQRWLEAYKHAQP